MSNMVGMIITDCADGNARVRQTSRFEGLFNSRPGFLGVGARMPDIEAAGNLLDQLDVITNLPTSREDTQAVILVNVAPRGDKVREKWENGTPFCYFRIKNVLVVSTYAGRALSLLKDRGLADSVELLDVPTVTAEAVKWGELSESHADRINHTQFRSLEFLPLVAHWITQGRPVPSTTYPVDHYDIKGKVWCIDNFGNAKTTLLPSDIGFEEGKTVVLKDGQQATCYNHLADVPKNETALVVGSSGYGKDRFLELVVQWHDDGFHGSDSAASRHNLGVGSTVLG